MEPQQRAATVVAITNQKRGEIDRLAETIGPPCTDCRYQRRKVIPTARGTEWKAYCGAPPAQNYRYDPVVGKMEVSTPITAASARSPGGLCGIEAQMFHAKPPIVFAARRVKRIAGTANLWLCGTLVTGGLLVAFLS